jgi:hypothetical protein
LIHCHVSEKSTGEWLDNDGCRRGYMSAHGAPSVCQIVEVLWWRYDSGLKY